MGGKEKCMMHQYFPPFLKALKEIISQSDLYLVNLSSKTYVFEDKLT